MFAWLADQVVFTLLRLEPHTHLAQALHFFVLDVSKIFVLLASLMTLMGFVRTWVQPQQLQGWVKHWPRPLAYCVAALVGALTPFCSCSSIPLFITMMRGGLPLSVATTFLVTSPMINEVAVAVMAGSMGMAVTIVYVVIGLTAGMIAGWLVDVFALKTPHLTRAPAVPKLRSPAGGSVSLQQRLAQGWQEAQQTISTMWPYVIVGVALGALMHGYVPATWVATHLSANALWTVPAAVVAGIPLYLNAVAAVPLLEVLVDKGLPLGTALALLLAGVAISLPEMTMLRAVLPWRLIVYLVGYLFVALTLMGWVVNATWY